MADLGNGPEQVGEFNSIDETIAFTLEPIGTLPELPKMEQDTTLDVPTFDIPEGNQEPNAENLEVEHETTVHNSHRNYFVNYSRNSTSPIGSPRLTTRR